MEFATEFLQFSSLGTSIYRLHVQMSIWLEKPRPRSDGRHKASGKTTVRSAFQISQKFFPELSRVRMVCLVVWTVAPLLHAISILRLRGFGL
jgi:hypothetical protein